MSARRTYGSGWPVPVLLVALATAVLAVTVTAGPTGPPGLPVAPSASRPATTTTTTSPGPDTLLPIEDAVERAERRAALAQLCLAAMDDPVANAHYQRARAAQPTIADGIGSDCQLVRRPAGRTGIAIG